MLESKEIVWLVCDICVQEYGSPDDDLMDGLYEDENRLVEDAKRDGWLQKGPEWFCEDCSVKEGLRNDQLTGVQQAALMHGKRVVL